MDFFNSAQSKTVALFYGDDYCSGSVSGYQCGCFGEWLYCRCAGVGFGNTDFQTRDEATGTVMADRFKGGRECVI